MDKELKQSIDYQTKLLEDNNKLLRENNEMLRDIIAYINYVVVHGDQENRNDFLMNIAANIIGNRVDWKFVQGL